MEELGSVPMEGEELEYESENAFYKIESYKDKRILKVRITKKIEENNEEIDSSDNEKGQE